MSPIDNQGRIRTQALALIRQDDRILVERCRDDVKDEWFHRLLGGTVEFGERSADTVRRELLEELGTEVDVGRLEATIENIFTFEGAPGHEICLVYECSLRDERLYGLDEWRAEEMTPDGPLTHEIAWKPVDSFRSDGEILYPDELVGLLSV
ncbi:MAG: NUDIX domain-containing protein [Actinomycetota bacterium]